MPQVSLAAGHHACHTLWVAALSLHDVCSVLPYYMHATGLTQGFLGKALTAITEPGCASARA